MTDDNITTKKDFALFIKECNYWMDKFSISYWVVTYTHKDLELPMLAWCNAQIEDCLVELGLNENWKLTKPTTKEICKKAFHEACELLIWPLQDMATDLYSELAVSKERHKILGSLEKTIFNPYWELKSKKESIE